MSCEEVQTRLAAYLDGELAPEMSLPLEAHLNSCADCAAARDEIQTTLALASVWQLASEEAIGETPQLITPEETAALLTEMRKLRAEVAALRGELGELKRQSERQAALPSATTSILRFPYSPVRDIPRPIV